MSVHFKENEREFIWVANTVLNYITIRQQRFITRPLQLNDPLNIEMNLTQM